MIRTLLLLGLAAVSSAACDADAVVTNERVTVDVGDNELLAYTGRDSIPPVYSPAFASAGEAGLAGDDIVLGVSIGDDHRAYKATDLRSRGMVNDVVGGVPLLVSW